MTDTVVLSDLKAKHRAVWASGDYPAVAELVRELGETLVDVAGVRAGQRVLDVAAGTGNAAIAAALAGADVVASDLTPELLDVGRRAAQERGARLAWEQADAEALPYADASFDVVLSCIGAMFAPQHQATADELVRVLRPGGTLALASWTPGGFIGQMFATMKPFAPAPPPGAQPPPLWGDEEHVRALLGDRVHDVRTRTRRLPVTLFPDGEAFRAYFADRYGPTIAVRRSLRDDPERLAQLDQALRELADRALEEGVMGWEYLLLTATRS
ncbi:class I SAM-dependent methyltransferase [Cellulosimicrobium cellulans]|uniref:class I SAM-dependent methyltransferase n=1 Tax=Cellulosimicrobium cellulans TaxID=1710 RepID=UPI00196418E1|nr:class I SAM-dependent methyltransferase [Cellulosimicrobium cellulans]MBN0041395.1 class I SAM-dependent methyltransferase [Cellulosimicrobium cellulans]